MLAVTTTAVVRPFSHKCKSGLITDASIYGIGAVLKQHKHPFYAYQGDYQKLNKDISEKMLKALAITAPRHPQSNGLV